MKRDHLLLGVAAVSAAGLALLYALFIRSRHGLAFDARAFAHASGDAPLPYAVVGERTLRTIDVGTIVLALVVLPALALVRGQPRRAAVAAVVTVAPVLTAELLKRGLPFPSGRPPTFPSGHTAIAVSLGFAVVIAVPPLLRVTAALAGAAYGAAIAFAVVVRGWHYPSDAAASFFLCGVWVSLLGLALRSGPRGIAVSPRGAALGLLAVAGALGLSAVIASRHPYAVAAARSTPAIAALGVAFGVLSLALFAVLTPLLGEYRESPR
jgi:hypothetical protein